VAAHLRGQQLCSGCLLCIVFRRRWAGEGRRAYPWCVFLCGWAYLIRASRAVATLCMLERSSGLAVRWGGGGGGE